MSTVVRGIPRRMNRAGILVSALAATLAALALFVLAPPSGHAAVGTFANPVATAPYGADPWMGYYNGYYYVATTTWNSQLVIKKAASVADLAGAQWHVVYTGSGTTACCNMWAPDLRELNGPDGLRWYYYYSAGPSTCCGNQHSYVLESAGTDPMGPYTFKAQLLTRPSNGWSIDGSVMTLGGMNYFVFSSFGATDGLQDLFVAPMSNPWTLSAYGSEISSPSLSWETVGGSVNEGPFALQHGTQTFLTYSTSSCNTPNYAVGMLTYNGGDPLSAASWVKSPNPVFQQNAANSVYGPGGQGFFTSPDGTETWVVYHANETTAQGCGATRTTRIQKISWNADGTPNLGSPASLGSSLALPAGDPGGSAPGFPAPATNYQVTNQNSGKLLEAVSCGTANGTAIDQQDSLGSACQQWSFSATGSNYYTIKNGNSGTLLDSVNCGTANGTAVDLWSALGNTCQQWSVSPIDGYYLVANRNSGNVLDVTNCSMTNGTAVQQWTALGNTCQQWSIAPATSAFPVVGTTYRLINANSAKVLDAVNCGTANGTNVDQWTSLGNSCQQWKFASAGAGYYTITNVNSGKLLDGVNCGTTNGSGVDLWTALGNTCQQWSVTATGNYYIVRNRNSGLVLDVANCSTADGATVRQWSDLGNTCQEWTITP